MKNPQMESLLAYMQKRFDEMEALVKLGLVNNVIQELSSVLDDFPTIKHNELYLQLNGKEWRISDWREQAINAFIAAGNEGVDVKEVDVYLKPEDHKGYYVINKVHEGSFDLGTRTPIGGRSRGK